MKKLYTLILLACFLLTGTVQGQQGRYLSKVFTDVKVTPDVTYGVNATIALLQQAGEAVPQTLKCDIYEPEGDNLDARPLIILLHSGNFLPASLNGGCNMTQKDDYIVYMANELAKRGFVVASADYRIGWNPVGDAATRVYTLINAAYRGVQDLNTCVRYFNKSAAEGNPYKVDVTKITAWGEGTGGYITLAAATLDTITQTYLPKFFIGATPMVLEQVSGNVQGTTVGISPGAPLPFPAGDTLCYPNHANYSSEFHLCVNQGGALGDSSWLAPGNMPMISFHVPTDPNAPCVSGIVNVPVLNLPVVDVVGSCWVQPKANEYGNNDVFVNANFNDPITQAAKAKNGGIEGFLPFPSNDPLEGSQWQFWNSKSPYGVPSANCDTTAANKATAITYMDSIFAYFAPRACVALNLGCNFNNTIDLISPAETGLQLSPVPADEFFRVSTREEYPFKNAELYDLNGRLVSSYANLRTNNLTFHRGNLNSGIYVLRLQFEKGETVSKVMFR